MAEINGTSGDDTLVGTSGGDTLNGGAGADGMYGGAGDDVYFVDRGGDFAIEAENEGRDIVLTTVTYALTSSQWIEILSAFDNASLAAMDLHGNELSNELWGTAGVNLLSGNDGNDALLGFAGVDTLLGGAGADYLDGGADGDALFGGSGDDTLIGGSGSDYLDGGTGADGHYGGTGNDVYFFDSAADFAIEAANAGSDIVYTTADFGLASGSEIELIAALDGGATTAINLHGNELANQIWGNNGANILSGFGGDDVLIGFGGGDLLLGGGGRDYLDGGDGADTLDGGSEGDMLVGGGSDDGLTGGAGDDTLVGGAGNDYMNGGTGLDGQYGGSGDDSYYFDSAGDFAIEAVGDGRDIAYSSVSYALTPGQEVEILSALDNGGSTALDLHGNDFANQVWGNEGVNFLSGGGGDDALIGFGGADLLIGGAGNDYLDGGAGADTFAFVSPAGGGNVDTIVGFSSFDDLIVLDRSVFQGLAAGSLTAGTFIVAAAAQDANDYLVYDSATGALYFDADGNGVGAQIQFARLDAGLALTAADFFVTGPANHLPTITSPGTASVAENSPAGTVVYQAAATDADGDRISWSLTGADAAALEIDSVTGTVRIKASPDFEVKSSYSFGAVASDSAGSTVRAVTLQVGDMTEVTTTPIVEEQGGNNDSSSFPQLISRDIFLVADNPNLDRDDLPSITIAGLISSPSDQDWYRVELQAGELIIIDVDNSGGNLDTMVRLFDNRHTLELIANDDPEGVDPGSEPHPQYGHNTDSFIKYRVSTSGTYFIQIESLQDPEHPTQGSYQLNVSIGPPAAPAELIQEDVEALISGAAWNHLDLTFGFPTQASQYPSTFPEADPASDLHPFSASQQAATRQLLQLVANVSTLTFTELTGGTGLSSGAGSANLRYAMSTDPEVEVAYAFYPTNRGPNSEGGTAWFNTEDFNSPIRGNYDWMGILHETGHALGLKHGHEAPAIRSEVDSIEYSVMTYRSYPGQDLSAGGGYTNETWGFSQTLMMYDIAALQQIYGPNYNFNAGNSVYRWNPVNGMLTINDISQGVPGANRILMTIWDGGGTDTYDLSAYSNGSTIDLRPGEWTSTSALQLANLGQGHFARGNIANALMYHGNTTSLIENAIGGSGGDTLIANQAKNQLTGNDGADMFKWTAAAGTGAGADTIMDLARGTDKINLADIDAVAGGNDDGFSFIGTNAFHSVAGELRYQVEGNDVRIQGDIDGNGVSDFDIVVLNNTILSSSDFFL